MTVEEINQNLSMLGVTSETPIDEARSTLREARFTDEEIETAVTLLQTTTTTSAAPVESPIPSSASLTPPTLVSTSMASDERVLATRKLFRTQQALQPDEIQQLLGVEVAIDTRLVEIERRGDYLSILQYVLVWFFSVLIAVCGIMFYMYINHVGFFHEQVGIAQIR